MDKFKRRMMGVCFFLFVVTNIAYAQSLTDAADTTAKIAGVNPLLGCVWLATLVTAAALWLMYKKDEKIDRQTDAIKVLSDQIGKQNLIAEKNLEIIRSRPCLIDEKRIS